VNVRACDVVLIFLSLFIVEQELHAINATLNSPVRPTKREREPRRLLFPGGGGGGAESAAATAPEGDGSTLRRKLSELGTRTRSLSLSLPSSGHIADAAFHVRAASAAAICAGGEGEQQTTAAEVTPAKAEGGNPRQAKRRKREASASNGGGGGGADDDNGHEGPEEDKDEAE
jgi:hypothetical protein